jgi:hypothetical protein
MMASSFLPQDPTQKNRHAHRASCGVVAILEKQPQKLTDLTVTAESTVTRIQPKSSGKYMSITR